MRLDLNSRRSSSRLRACVSNPYDKGCLRNGQNAHVKDADVPVCKTTQQLPPSRLCSPVLKAAQRSIAGFACCVTHVGLEHMISCSLPGSSCRLGRSSSWPGYSACILSHPSTAAIMRWQTG
jgi:hypothetical protein